VCCSVLQSDALEIINDLPIGFPINNIISFSAVCCSVLQCVAVSCSVLAQSPMCVCIVVEYDVYGTHRSRQAVPLHVTCMNESWHTNERVTPRRVCIHPGRINHQQGAIGLESSHDIHTCMRVTHNTHTQIQTGR